jgi:peptidoglycan/xylan/chitin deacetylase (PgdA/CDA1 family)
MYHYIRVNPNPKDQLGFGLSVTPADFDAQMNHMAKLGYRSITLSDLDNPANHDGKTFVITFDDGYADFHDVAIPIMQKYGFKGTCYIITGLVGYPSFMSWVQVVDSVKQGMTVGSHTINHPNLPTLKAATLRQEVSQSRTILESMGLPVSDFCYPSGKYDTDVIAAVREAGYKTAVTVEGGKYKGGDHFTMPRVRIQGGMTLSEFAAAVTPGQPPR